MSITEENQSTDTILMVRPASFYSNPETQVDNAFQSQNDLSEGEILAKARIEFDAFVEVLRGAGVCVMLFEDQALPVTPDAIFPNNWFSTHAAEDVAVLYPMKAENRRLEIREDVIDILRVSYSRVLDLSSYAAKGQFLEGTGSLVLHRPSKTVYAALSARTDREILSKWCDELGYTEHLFHAADSSGNPVYHTNVLMGIGSGYAVFCSEAIPDTVEKMRVLESLHELELEVIDISWNQVLQFSGNVLEVEGADGKKYLAMSTQANNALMEEQRGELEHYARILHSPLDTIEKYGGGGARCMLAELFGFDRGE